MNRSVMTKKAVVVLICGVMPVLTPRPANAGPITFTFGGQVTEVIDDNNLLGGAVTLGTEFSGSYTFESTTPDSIANPNAGVYPDTVSSIVGQVGGIPFTGPILQNGTIIVVNDGTSRGIDFYTVGSRVSLLSESLSFDINLIDDTGTAFGTDALPLTPPELQSFQSLSFSIADEALPLFINGNITSLVPEPATLVLLMLGVGAVATRLRVRRRKERRDNEFARTKGGPKALLIGIVACTLILSAPRLAYATDCNGNTIDDAAELAVCPAIDLVFVIDTSGSTAFDLTDLCNAIDAPNPSVTTDVISVLELGGLTVNYEILAIGTIVGNCDCCAGTVVGVYGPVATGFPFALNTCNGCQAGDCEDWGTATGIVAANKVWGNGPRIIIPISDEGPRCGNPINDPGDDRNLVENAIPIVAGQRVIVGPVIDKSVVCLEQLAQDLADGGEREVECPVLATSKPESAGVPALVKHMPLMVISSGESR